MVLFMVFYKVFLTTKFEDKILNFFNIQTTAFEQYFPVHLMLLMMINSSADRGTQRFVSGNICLEGLKSPEIFGINCSES